MEWSKVETNVANIYNELIPSLFKENEVFACSFNYHLKGKQKLERKKLS